MWADTWLILMIVLVMVINTLCVAAVLITLPGTWVMLAVTVLLAWWQWDDPGGPLINGWTIVLLVALALLGELLEFVAGMWGASKAGGAKRSVVLALVGGLVGAIAGTFLLAFIPLFGTLIGAALGAGLGSFLGELWKGRSVAQATEVGKGAAIGRFWGTVFKVVVAVLMWLVVFVAVLW